MPSISGKVKSVSVEEFAAGYKLVLCMDSSPIEAKWTAWKNQNDDPRQACFTQQDKWGIRKGVAGIMTYEDRESKINPNTGKPYVNHDLTDFKVDEVQSTVAESTAKIETPPAIDPSDMERMRQALVDGKSVWIDAIYPDANKNDEDLTSVDYECIQKVGVTLYLDRRKWN